MDWPRDSPLYGIDQRRPFDPDQHDPDLSVVGTIPAGLTLLSATSSPDRCPPIRLVARVRSETLIDEEAGKTNVLATFVLLRKALHVPLSLAPFSLQKSVARERYSACALACRLSTVASYHISFPLALHRRQVVEDSFGEVSLSTWKRETRARAPFHGPVRKPGYLVL